jgi:hypothetical protein
MYSSVYNILYTIQRGFQDNDDDRISDVYKIGLNVDKDLLTM